MAITITKKAQEYLIKKQRYNIIIALDEILCWGGRKRKAITILAKKNFSNRNNFTEYRIGEFKIFIAPNLILDKNNVTIDINKFLFISQLTQTGVSY